jgi:hypothetical protein
MPEFIIYNEKETNVIINEQGIKAHHACIDGAVYSKAQFIRVPRETVLLGPKPNIARLASCRIQLAIARIKAIIV